MAQVLSLPVHVEYVSELTMYLFRPQWYAMPLLVL